MESVSKLKLPNPPTPSTSSEQVWGEIALDSPQGLP